jgi:membrane protein
MRHVQLAEMGVLSRTLKAYIKADLTDWAAALTYYSVLSLFPALLMLVALLGVFGQYPETTDALLHIVQDLAPPSVVEVMRRRIATVVLDNSGAGALLGIGLAAALWSASGYVGAFTRASNRIYEVGKRRFVAQRLLQLGSTLALVVLVGIMAAALVLSGPLAERVGALVGLGETALIVWSIVKWPLLLVAVMTLISLLYWLAPNVRHPDGYRWVTPGGVVAVLIGIAASAGFAFYVANLDSYDRTYGSLGAVIIFLVWLYIANNALLFGALLDAEVERERAHEEEPARRMLRLPERGAGA